MKRLLYGYVILTLSFFSRESYAMQPVVPVILQPGMAANKIPLQTKPTPPAETEDCSLCLDALDNKDDLTITLSCGHRFHLPCLVRIVESQEATLDGSGNVTGHIARNRCPVCQALIKVNDPRLNKNSFTAIRGIKGALSGNQAALLQRFLTNKNVSVDTFNENSPQALTPPTSENNPTQPTNDSSYSSLIFEGSAAFLLGLMLSKELSEDKKETTQKATARRLLTGLYFVGANVLIQKLHPQRSPDGNTIASWILGLCGGIASGTALIEYQKKAPSRKSTQALQ